MKKPKQILLLLGVFLLFNFNNITAQVVTSPNDDGSPGSLRQQILNAIPGAEITFSAITSLNLNSEIVIDKELTISGSTLLSVIIDGQNQTRIFNVTTGSLTLNNLSLINGSAADGGAIYNTGTLTMNDCTVSNSVANGASGSGGGIFNDVGGVLVINNSSLLNNIANRAGGAIEDKSGAGLAITLNNVTMDGNNAGVSPALAAPGNGGALHITGAGSSSISSCTITDNIAALEGGGLWNGSGTMTIVNTMISNNLAAGDMSNEGGGGVFNAGGTVDISGSTISGNEAAGAAGSGGGILNDLGVLTVLNTEISGNASIRAGGGIEDNSAAGNTLSLTDVMLMNNTTAAAPGNGGGLHITGPGNSMITNCTVSGNEAALEGGGLWNGSGMMTVTGSTITNNIATGAMANEGGGGIFNAGGTLEVSGSTISGNSATGAAGSGGGILNDQGVLTVADTEISTNNANRAGGGIEDNSVAGNTLSLTQVMLMNNTTAAAPGNGGGLHITGSGDAMISSSTVSGNEAALEGGGLWNGSGTMTVTQTMITDNTAAGAMANEGGGGVFNAGGTLNINGSSITGNSATGAAGSGGGILNDMGTLTITTSQINTNTAVRAGGGIEDNSMAGNTLSLTQVMLMGNTTAAAPGNGGGLHITGPGDAVINTCSITDNEAALEGGGLWNGSGTMTVTASMISNNTAAGAMANEGGGGIFNAGGTLSVEGSSITGNSATGAAGSGGGILNDQGSLTVIESEINNNTAVRAGGGIEDNSVAGNTLVLTNIGLIGNTTTAAPGNGGGLHITGPGDAMITACTVTDNVAASEGGGLWNSVGLMTVSNSTISGNTASGAAADNGGGGIFNNGGTLTINNTTNIANNTATGAAGSGGGLLSTVGTVTIENTNFTGNSANRAGGAIELIDGNLDFSNSTMIANDVNGTAGTAAPGNGGGLHITGNAGVITITDATVSGNEAAREGGGLWNQSGTTMTVTRSTIDGNISFGIAADDGGAGIFNNGGVLNVNNSTVSNNEDMGTAAAGAGIHNHTGGEVMLMLSTISGNTSNRGGGIYNNGTSFTINASTIALNNATTAGGGINAATETGLKNSIVADNNSADGTDVSGTFVSSNYNLIGNDDENAFPAAGDDVEGMDPKLEDLQTNGNATATHRLAADSPAYNTGDPNDSFADQNGQAVFGGRRDMGSDEAQSALTSTQDLSFNETGIQVFPNPTPNEVNLTIPTSFGEELTVSVYELSSGRLMRTEILRNGSTVLSLNGLGSGIYNLRFVSEKYATSQRVIKVN